MPATRSLPVTLIRAMARIEITVALMLALAGGAAAGRGRTEFAPAIGSRSTA